MTFRRAVVVLALVAGCAAAADAGKVASNCRYNGVKLYGRVQVVNAFPDLKVQVVESFPDLKVKTVEAFPDSCGEWKFVAAGGDFKIQFVDSFPDITVKLVESFPGLPDGTRVTGDGEIASDCTFGGKKLYGRVALVEHGGDVKIRIVESGANLRVKKSSSGASRCGEWNIVEHGADLKVQIVDSGADFTVRFVESNPGM